MADILKNSVEFKATVFCIDFWSIFLGILHCMYIRKLLHHSLGNKDAIISMIFFVGL